MHAVLFVGRMLQQNCKQQNICTVSLYSLFFFQDGETEKVVLVDYQLLNYGCPVNDFMYFIYTCTDREFRSQHLEHIKHVYHSTLSRFLKYFDIDAEDVYPRKEFERVLADRKDFGMILALYYYAIIFVPESDVPDVGDGDFFAIDFNLDPRGWERFLEVVDEFWGKDI